jgi:hypothetical protein
MNRARGDVALMLDGRRRTLRLTFGALAEIEGVLGVSSLGELGARLGRLTGAELLAVLEALMRGAGHAEPIDGARVELKAAAHAVAEAFRAALE